jgi:hypothetical protein
MASVKYRDIAIFPSLETKTVWGAHPTFLANRPALRSDFPVRPGTTEANQVLAIGAALTGRANEHELISQPILVEAHFERKEERFAGPLKFIDRGGGAKLSDAHPHTDGVQLCFVAC